MFWGLVLEPGKKYTKTVENAFRLTTAVLDTTTKDQNVVRVFVEKEDIKVLVGNLGMKANVFQIPLDLQFIVGDQISLFTSGGKAAVHLSGYLVPEDDPMGFSFGEEADSDEVSEEESEEDDEEEEVPQLVTGKRKLNGIKDTNAKKKKVTVEAVSPPESKKKTKLNNEGVVPAAEAKSPLLKNFTNKLLAVKEESDSDDSDFLNEEDSDAEDILDEDDDDDSSDDDAEEEEDDDEGMEMDSEDNYEDAEEEEPLVIVAPVSPSNKKTPNKKSPNKKTPNVKTPTVVQKTEVTIKTPKSEKKKMKQENQATPQDANKSISTKTPKSEKKKNKQLKALANGTTPEKTVSSPSGKSPNNQTKVQQIGSDSKQTKIVKAGGIICEDLQIGQGAEVKNGKHVSMYYEGKLKSNNKTFDKTVSGPPFKFRLGGGEVIKGWDIGIQGMKIGGKRRLTIPPHMGYGKRGALPDIPANSTLVFDVELKGQN